MDIEIAKLREISKIICRDCEKRGLTIGEAELLPSVLSDEIKKNKEALLNEQYFKRILT